MPRARTLLALALAGCCPASSTKTVTTPTPPDKDDIVQPTEVRPLPETRIDGGTLAIAINGTPAGTEGFEWSQYGDEYELENHVDATLFGKVVRGHGEMHVDAQGRSTRGVFTMSVDGVAIATSVAGGPDAMVVTVKAGDGAAKEQRAAGHVDVYLDDTSFSHIDRKSVV